MFIYILLLLIAIFFLLFDNIKKNSKLPTVFIAILAFVAAFRYDVGQDYMSYCDIFNGYKLGRSGVGFQVLCDICKYVGGTSQLMFFVMSVLTLTLFFLSMKKSSTDLMLSLFVFFCFGQMYLNTFNTIRQCLAAALFMFSISFLLKRKLLYFVILLLFASTFHISALVLIPLYWVLDRELPYKYVLAIGAVAYFVGSFNPLLFIVQVDEYQIYQKFEEIEISFIDYLYLLMSVIIFIYRKKLFQHHPYKNVFNNINIIFGFFTLLYILSNGADGALLLNRIRYYFVFFYAVILQLLLSEIKNKDLYMVSRFGMAFILSVLFVRTTIILGDNYNLTPYNFNFKLF